MSKKENKIKEKVLEKVEEAKALVEPTTQEPTKEEGSFKIKNYNLKSSTKYLKAI